MARTPLAQELLKIGAQVASADRCEPARPSRAEALSRRAFLERAAKASLGALAGGMFLGREARGEDFSAKIAIVGGGLAGLTCAFKLKQFGFLATVYEGATELGGRCRTRRGFFEEGQLAERGGEFIDTGHTDVRKLAAELGLRLENVLKAEAPGTKPFYFFDGARYGNAALAADFQKLLPKLKADLRAADYPTLYHHYTTRGVELDAMSITDWINESVPGGVASKFGQLLDVAYNIEYGAESSQQSALNLLYLLGYSQRSELQLFGPSDERFHIKGGNDLLVSGLAARLEGRIQTGKKLTAIVRENDNRYALTFALNGGGNEVVIADQVVLALPFSILRTGVDLSQAGFSPLKQTAISELGMGTNSKLHVQFTNRRWRNLGCNGETFADTGYQATWEASRAQPGDAGLLVNFTGGDIGASFGSGTAESYATQFLTQIEPVFPGVSTRANGKATLEYWTGNPFSLGAYSYWKVGQYRQFAGIEGEAEGNCHFAGEHTSIDYQGFLNGAVATGKRAAREVRAALTPGG